MAQTLKFGNGVWANKEGSTLAYNDENGNYKPLPFNFTRSSSATRVNKQGLIEVVRNNKPRIDFKDSAEGALILEPSRSNSIRYSEDFTQWNSVGGGVTSNQTISPDGSLNADKLFAQTNNGQHRLDFTSSNVAGATTFSFFAKSAEYNSVWARIGLSSTYFDLENGVSFNNTGNTSSVEYYGNGWYRCILTKEVSSANEVCRINITQYYKDSSEWTGDGTSGVYIYGAQLEVGSYGTSLINTSGSAVTRVADVCNNGANAQVINSTEGVLYAEIKGFISQDTIDQNRYITITNGTSNERVALLLGGNSNQLRAVIYSSTQSVNLSFTTSLTDAKQYNKLAVKYKSGDYAFFLNGVKIGGSTETSIFSENTLNDFSFDVGGGTQQFRGMVKGAKLYNTELTDIELETLTSWTSFTDLANGQQYSIK